MQERYDPRPIEGKWQEAWESAHVFKAADNSTKPKYYCLCMFPYPSGSIHMGHVRNYAIGDIISRYKRMRGFNVMQPIGWDAFGLPAENAAIQRSIHPKDWTLQNIAQMKVQFKSLGISYDWDREVATCLPEYFKWEQMLFGKFLEQGLAYKKKGTVNWCADCETVLANEQVVDGKCWRCDNNVTLKELNQWYFKITDYADQLLSGHSQLEKSWPDRVLDMQKHWIGKSEGARIQFAVKGAAEKIEVFTTRPDTLFGVTFVTIAPFHPLAEMLCTTAETKTQLEKLKKEVQLRPRDVEQTTKDGFATGSKVVHPLLGTEVPIWVGDFVVMEYGTGAVMGVPAHDQRDYEFATKFGLKIQQVISAGETPKDAAFTEAGTMVNSGKYDGQPSEKAKTAITQELESKGLGKGTTQYRLRDWGISRQRYWGAPVPVVYCAKCGAVSVPEKDLPLELPYDVQFSGKQGNPLAHHPTFKKTHCPKCGGPAERETDTMDTFVESSWYFARFASPTYDKGPFEKKAVDYWMPVDFYIGGVEHACMHLLYARFFHKVLRDWGLISGDEPFKRLLTQGMVIKDGAKMSKSKGNVVSPATILDQYGADTARLFSLFAAPPEKDLDWNEKGVEGCHRFLHRIWRLFHQFHGVLSKPAPDEKALQFDAKLTAVRRKTHWMIQKMTEDIEADKFNTAISAAMELVNEVYGVLSEDEKHFRTDPGIVVLKEACQSLILCLAPYAPHLCEELWHELGFRTLIANEKWPAFRQDLLAESTFTLVIQVNGKMRDKITLPKNLKKEEIQARVLALPKVAQFMEGKSVKTFVYVPERLANVVTA